VHRNLSISTCYGRVMPVLAIVSGHDIDEQEDELSRDSIVYAVVKDLLSAW